MIEITSSLAASALGPSERAVSPKAAHAAREFEALMVARMLQSARQAAEAFGKKDASTGSQNYRELAEEHLARMLAQSGAFGLGPLLEREFQRVESEPPDGGP